MILKSFEYYEFLNDEKYWAIKPFELGRINLFTAKNATGKTRTIKAINWLSIIIKNNYFNDDVNYNVIFSDKNEIYQYLLNNDDKKVISEKIIGNNTTLLLRDSKGIGELFTAQLDRNLEFQVQTNKLAISRRDLLQYPYLEKFHIWAESVQYYPFGSSMNQEYGKTVGKAGIIISGKSDNSVEVFVVGELEFNKEFKKNVLDSMNTIGYNLDDIDVRHGLYSNLNVRLDDHTLYASEKDRNAIVTQNSMSQGMFRALSIIIHLTYHAMMGEPTTVLIDDIGEGLDFERSTKLIKLLIDIAEKNENIQLIMSTNDRYVMNNVPLKYWHIIQRSGGECNVFNYKTSKDKFEEFKFTGLNNFDFLATDFINTKLEKK